MKKNMKKCFMFALGLLGAAVVGSSVSLVKPEAANADAAAFEMISGASIRVQVSQNEEGNEVVSEATTGMRFHARINRTTLENLYAAYDSVSAGMIIVPTDYIAAAGGYTFEELSTFSLLEGATYSTITKDFKEVGTDLEYYSTITQIQDANFSRSFSAVGFIKVEEADAADIALLQADENFVEFDGAYYWYTAYSENNNSRCVYDVAFAAHNDRKTASEGEYTKKLDDGTFAKLSQAQMNKAKKYLDAVAVLAYNKTSKKVEIANNTSEYYTSPYSVIPAQDTYYLSSTPKGMLYNDARIKGASYTDETNNVAISTQLKSSGMTVNADGSVTLAAPVSSTFNSALSFGTLSNLSFSHLGFDVNYGVGQYMDFYFTGNNMPNVMFFADSIDGNLTYYDNSTAVDTRRGIIATPGFITNKKVDGNGGAHRFHVYGPYRMRSSKEGGQTVAGNAGNDTVAAAISYAYQAREGYTAANSMFYQGFNANTGLSNTDAYKNQDFHYVIGTKDVGGKLVVEATMYTVAADGTETKIGAISLTTKIDTSTLAAGKIVVYSAMKQDSSATTFKFGAPHS